MKTWMKRLFMTALFMLALLTSFTGISGVEPSDLAVWVKKTDAGKQVSSFFSSKKGKRSHSKVKIRGLFLSKKPLIGTITRSRKLWQPAIQQVWNQQAKRRNIMHMALHIQASK